MINVILPDSSPHRLPFYLTMEEWIARRLPAGDYFFTWQVDPTVIFGRNQDIDKEVDLDYCRRHGIAFYRRRSGGGCVFADRSNIMFSFITPSEQVVTTFSRYTSLVARMLQSLGLDAEAGGRNDITVGGRKVSGNAFYHLPGRSIVHGTMLYDTDLAHMAGAITPSRSKLESKKVASVESHITTLCRHLDIDINEFIDYATRYLADSTLQLSASQVEEIEEMSQPYYTREWIYGRRNARSISKDRRIEGVGEFNIDIERDGDRIRDIEMHGDFFITGDLDSLLDKIKGTEATPAALAGAIAETDCGSVIAGLEADDLIRIILD